MNESKLCIANTKSFEVKPQFGHHIDSKYDRLLLNFLDLLRICFNM